MSASRKDSPPLHNQPILPRHNLARDDALAPRRQPPPSRPKRLVQYTPVLDLRQVQYPVGLDFYILVHGRCEQRFGLLGREGYAAETVVRARPVDGGHAVDFGGRVGEAVCEGAFGAGVVGGGVGRVVAVGWDGGVGGGEGGCYGALGGCCC